jgi:hypothetical protein
MAHLSDIPGAGSLEGMRGDLGEAWRCVASFPQLAVASHSLLVSLYAHMNLWANRTQSHSTASSQGNASDR